MAAPDPAAEPAWPGPRRREEVRTSAARLESSSTTPAPINPMTVDGEDATAPIRSRTRLYAILAALYTSLFLAALDATIVATAIPTIAGHLHSASGYTWIGGAYLLANAASAPIWAKLSDIWGRKPILLAVVALFFLSSIVCALATSMTMLIVGRALQGVAGGGIFQLVSIVISDLFSQRQRAIFFGFMEVVWTIASGVGPILGGALAQKLSWRWIWWINLPLSGITFVLLLLFLNVHNPKTRLADGLKALDWAGTLSIVGLTLMLLLGLEFGGETFPWDSPRVICLIVFGALMSLVFIWSEKKLTTDPVMPLSLFTYRPTLGCLLVDLCHAFVSPSIPRHLAIVLTNHQVFIAAQFFLPLFFQAVTGASPLRSGILILPLVVMASLLGMVSGFYIHKTGQYVGLIWTGTVLLTIGTGLFILFDADSSVGLLVGLQFVGGSAAGFLFQPPLIALQVHVQQDDVATATATFGFVREIGSAVSIVIGGVVFQNSMSIRSNNLQAAGASPEVIAQFTGSDAAANALVVKTIADPAVRRAVEEAFAFSLRNMWIMFTVVAFLGIVATSLISHKALSEEHTETKTGLKKKEET